MFRRRHCSKVPISHILVWLQHPQHCGPFVLTEVSQIDMVLPAFDPLRGCRNVSDIRAPGPDFCSVSTASTPSLERDTICSGWWRASPRTIPLSNILSFCEVLITRTLKGTCGRAPCSAKTTKPPYRSLSMLVVVLLHLIVRSETALVA
jgi:hypothetical protein